MSDRGEAILKKINPPAGDASSLRAYQEYVCFVLRNQISFEELRDLMQHFLCSVDEVVDKIIETKMNQNIFTSVLLEQIETEVREGQWDRPRGHADGTSI